MGWKFYTIFVKDNHINDNSEIETLLPELNLNSYKFDGEIGFYESLNSEFLCAGIVNNCLLITHQNLAMEFQEARVSDTEKAFIRRFPNSEISSLVYFSTTDLFGYSLIQNRKRLRVKSAADGEIFTNIGKKLDLEKEIKKNGVFDKEELEEMKEEMDREEINMMIDNEVGIRTTFQMSAWYLGKPLDEGNFENIKLLKFTKK